MHQHAHIQVPYYPSGISQVWLSAHAYTNQGCPDWQSWLHVVVMHRNSANHDFHRLASPQMHRHLGFLEERNSPSSSTHIHLHVQMPTGAEYRKHKEGNICNSFIQSGYFYSASSSPLQPRGAPNYSINTVSELTH